MKVALYIVGAALEMLGIILVAAPDLIPGVVSLGARLARAWRWITLRWRSLENRLRRRLGFGLRTHDASVVIGAGVAASMTLGTEVHINPGATPGEQVAFLLRRYQEEQQSVTALEERVGRLEAGLPRLREEVDELVTGRITESDAALRAVRIFGTLVLLVGVLVSTWGNLV